MKDESALPRFTKLDMFDPHRPSFECKHEASANPPITPEAEALFQQALAATSFEVWPEKRDYAKAAALYEQAMKLGHWKAQFNLAGAYLQGKGVPQDIEKAIQLTEDLMRKGVPAAWDNMGAYYMGGVGGLKQDATVAYAFWQKAADMGSMAAQTYIGAKLRGDHDEPPRVWANRSVGIKMLECAFAQGDAQAAYELGLILNVISEDYPRALAAFHEGVKRGSEKSANYLFGAFDDGDALVNKFKDRARAERYSALGDALYTNPDLRFPNLDKVLPLPPAPLPKWDGNRQTLIDAAKAVVPAPTPGPKPAASPASQRSGRAHIPDGYMLPEQPQVEVDAQYETTRAPEAGYWLAQLMYPRSERHARWNAEQLPLRYAAGELFDRTRPGLVDEDGRIRFHYLGQAVPVPVIEVPVNPRVAQGIAREATLPEPPLECLGDERCPATGIWAASVSDEHPHAAVFNHWSRQSYVMQGERFPDPRELHLDIEPMQVHWHYRGEANEQRTPTLAFIRVGEPAPKLAAAEADAPPQDAGDARPEAEPADGKPSGSNAAQPSAGTPAKRRWWQRS